MLSQWRDTINDRKLVKHTFSNIRVEVRENIGKLKKSLAIHQRQMVQADSIALLLEGQNERIQFSFNLNFVQMSSTAWQTAQLTQAIAHMDIESVSKIGAVYEYQDYYADLARKFSSEMIYRRRDDEEQELVRIIRNLLTVVVPVEQELVRSYDELDDFIPATN